MEGSENTLISKKSIENEYKSIFINKINNTIESDDDNDYLINIKRNNSNQKHNTVKEKTVINKNKKIYKKKNRQIRCNKLNYCRISKDGITNNRDIVLHNQSDNLEKNKLINGNDDNGNTSDLDYDTASNNDVFLDNSIFIKENEHLHRDFKDKFVYNNSNNVKKSIIKKGAKKQRVLRKKTEGNIKEENLNSLAEIGAEKKNSESNIRNIKKRNTKELKSLPNVDSKSILPEFMSLFAKPKNDNFFSKDNMYKFSKGACLHYYIFYLRNK